ncbi:MAG: hypothetical protein AAF805_06605 [Planctomycetota bacterium]
MDSEHRHELEENALARRLADNIERYRDQLPLVGVAAIALVAAPLVWSAYRSSSQTANAERWQGYVRAVEAGRPDLALLEKAAEDNAGTPVADWSRITWADGKLWEASNVFLRNREQADDAVGEAIAAYEELQRSSQREIAERATFGLARSYELQGDLDQARTTYARVTGGFAPLAEARIAELESPRVADDYAWLTGLRSTPAEEASDALATDLEPDDIAMPADDDEPVDTEAALDDLLGGLEDADLEATEGSAEEGAEAAADSS